MTYITIEATDESGSFDAYVATPKTGDKAPAVIVIQEIFGVNHIMREICDNLAQSGYLAVCPDLFWRQEPGIDMTDQSQAEWDRAFALFNGFNVDKAIEDLVATLDHTRMREDCNGRVGSLGYCLGGKLAYLMATRSDTNCSVSYYGVGIEDLLDEAKNIRQPLLMHMAGEDKFVSKDAQEVILRELDRYDLISMYVYDGQNHAFARLGGEHYDKDAANLANMRSADFLATYLVP